MIIVPRHATKGSFRKGQKFHLNGKRMGRSKGCIHSVETIQKQQGGRRKYYNIMGAMQIFGHPEKRRKRPHKEVNLLRRVAHSFPSGFITPFFNGWKHSEETKRKFKLAWIRRKREGRVRKINPKRFETVPCKICGKKFKKEKIKTKKKYCSNKCRFLDIESLKCAAMKAAQTNRKRGHYQRASLRMLNGGAIIARSACHRVSRPQKFLFDVYKKIDNKMELEYPVKLSNGRTAFVDIANPEQKFGIEYNGSYWHGTEEAKKRDKERLRLLKEQGWFIIETNEGIFRDLMKVNYLEVDLNAVRKMGVL